MATKTRRAAARRPRGEPVVRRVLEVTLDELARHGYERLSVPAIAKRAELNKTSIYRRWPTKADLVREALHASMGHGMTVPETGSLRDDLLAYVTAAVRFARSPLGTGVVRTLLAEGTHPDVRSLAATMMRAQDAHGPRRMLERAVARGELPKTLDVALLLSVVAGTLLHRLFIEHARVSRPELERLVDFVLRGAGAEHRPVGPRR